MAETGNISRMAEKLSGALFNEFLWQQSGPLNTNWTCEKPAHGVSTHPSDVVFWYDEPYSTTRAYVNCDLKSYAKGSITPAAIKAAMLSLVKQVECAEVSEQWQKRYIHDEISPAIHGLLFIYNHDGEFDADFSTVLGKAKLDDLAPPPGTKLFIIGPDDIHWLDNVRLDIALMRGQGLVPARENCSYFHPQLIKRLNLQQNKARAASLEMLQSPWIVLEHETPTDRGKRGIVVYHRREPTVASCMYLLAYLRQYQLMDVGVEIRVKGHARFKDAAVNFGKAKQSYLDRFGETEESNFKEYLESIEYSSLAQIVSVFSDIEIGMDIK